MLCILGIVTDPNYDRDVIDGTTLVTDGAIRVFQQIWSEEHNLDFVGRVHRGTTEGRVEIRDLRTRSRALKTSLKSISRRSSSPALPLPQLVSPERPPQRSRGRRLRCVQSLVVTTLPNPPSPFQITVLSHQRHRKQQDFSRHDNCAGAGSCGRGASSVLSASGRQGCGCCVRHSRPSRCANPYPNQILGCFAIP